MSERDSEKGDGAQAVKTLLLCDVVGSTKLTTELGDERIARIGKLHDLMARDLLPRFEGREIDKTDGFLLLFDLPLVAVRYAMAYHDGLDEISAAEGVELTARVGIHVGQVILRRNPPKHVEAGAKPLEVEGRAKPEAARIMSLAGGRQTLLSRTAFEMAKNAAVGHREATRLRWLFHGKYRLKGVDEPVEIYETGVEGIAPLTPPEDTEKARRVAEDTVPPPKRPPKEPTRLLVPNLPISGDVFVGRQEELRHLDEAWTDDGLHVVTVIAWGGVGKTALVNRWLSTMAAAGHRGARCVLGWSFYSQGTDEHRVAAADPFIDYALRELGDPDPTAGSPRDRGLRLAALVRAERTLVVLDGIEPLQHPPDSALAGRLKDPALAAFLKTLALGLDGLCVVTSREAVADLAQHASTTAPRIDLEHLTPDDGVEVLRHLGVDGSEKEMRRAVEEHGGHALALTLLGNYLRKAQGGDIRRRDKVEVKKADERQGGHAFRVMATYERWLGSTEVAVLRLMGLFDRPAPAGAIASLRAEPAITHLNEGLIGLAEEDWDWDASS